MQYAFTEPRGILLIAPVRKRSPLREPVWPNHSSGVQGTYRGENLYFYSRRTSESAFLYCDLRSKRWTVSFVCVEMAMTDRRFDQSVGQLYLYGLFTIIGGRFGHRGVIDMRLGSRAARSNSWPETPVMNVEQYSYKPFSASPR